MITHNAASLSTVYQLAASRTTSGGTNTLDFRYQSPVAQAFLEFDENGRMRPSPYYDRIEDVMEELVKFTLLV